MASIKDSQHFWRLSSEQDALIPRAAEITGAGVTQFTVGAAMNHAEDELADRRAFAIGDAAWGEFHAVLDRPVAQKPRLAELLSAPSIFAEG